MQFAQFMNSPAFARWIRAVAIVTLHAEQRPSRIMAKALWDRASSRFNSG